MLRLGQQLRDRHDRRGEQRREEEAQQRHHRRRHNEARHQPEEQLQPDRDGEVGRDGVLLRREEARRDEAQDQPADRHAGPEAGRGQARGEGGAVPDLQHEGHDPAAHGDLDAHVDEEEEGGEERAAVADGGQGGGVGEPSKGAEERLDSGRTGWRGRRCDARQGGTRVYDQTTTLTVVGLCDGAFLGVFGPEVLGVGGPEADGKEDELDHRGADHQVVEFVPSPACFRDQGGCDEG